MGIIRKTMSMGSLGAVDYRSDKERTAAYTKGTRKEAKKQTKIMNEQTKRQAEHDAAMAKKQTEIMEEQARRQVEHDAAMLAAQSGQAPAAPKVAQGSPVAPQSPPPGWYPDQVNPALVRWFDGQNWTDHLQPRQ